MKRLVVVGAGISGLAAAFTAAKAAAAAGAPLEVQVLERESQVGGKARTLVEDDFRVELGPSGYLDNEPAVDRLLAAAGLSEHKLPANLAAARRFLVRGGKLREAKPNPFAFAGSGLLGPLGLLRMALEPLIPAKRDGLDESVWEFARRRVGRQAADRLIAPMMLGVFAGDARRLSLPAALPRLHEIELRYGGLVRGMIGLKREKQAAGGPAGPRGVLTSFAAGLEFLPRQLAQAPELIVRCNTPVQLIDKSPGGSWRLVIAGRPESLTADAVLLAGEPWAMAPLVRSLAPVLADQLDRIFCPPVAVVALGYGPEALARVPSGFGVLVPRGERYRILGVLWDTFLFPNRSRKGTLLIRVMLGGAVDPEIGALEEDRIEALATTEAGRLLGLPAPPIFRKTVLWKRAIPQYELGHLDRVAAIESERRKLPGLFFAGNALTGIAFAKAVARGMAAGAEAGAFLMAGPRD